ncbi:MAG: hypothetical protein WC319_05675 [Candidatus Paceibacterota bacterium]|jgi:hypothetical protein
MLCSGIIEKGRKELENIERMNESLKEQGCEDDDIKTAIDLMACIVFFDKEIFGETNISLNLNSRDDCDMLAAYHSPEEIPDFPSGLYQVRVKKLFNDLTNWNARITFFEKDGKPGKDNLEDYRKASLQEKVVMKGCHEVRHQYQIIKKAIILQPYGIYYDSQINAYVKSMREAMENDIDNFYKGYEENKRLLEFDARVIERIIFGEFNGKITESRICEIIKTEVYSIGYLQ